MRKPWLGLLLVMAGCPDIPKDNNDGAVPYVEFDPANAIIPFPNNLVLDPMTGKVNLPAQACESPTQMQVRTKVLNKLDGFGTYEVGIQFTLSEPADMATLTASNILLYKRAAAGTPLASPGQPVPFVAFPGKTLRFDPNDCANPAMIDAVTVVPKVPLDEHGTYTLAVLNGVTPAGGGNFYASFVWGLVRQSVDPVAFDAMGNVITNRTPIPEPTASDPSDPNYAQLVGIDQLWQAHAAALAFLDATGALATNRTNVLVATDFNTQTTTDPLDSFVPNTPAANLGNQPIAGTFSVADARGKSCGTGQGCQAFMNAVIPNICNSVPCGAVGDILAGVVGTGEGMYQQPTPNPFDPALPIPGPWNDPVHPTSAGGWQQTDYLNPNKPPPGTVEMLAFIPQASTMPTTCATPPCGWPTVVFGHGLGSSKESLFAIGAQLAAAGFVSVAIDFQAHGSRAVPISKDPLLGCAGTCLNGGGACDTITACTQAGDTCVNGAGASIAPTASPQCYAPFLSPDLATTRDNIRQTVLDLHRLTHALKACGPSSCAATGVNGSVLAVDPARVVYMGISLGGIVGSTVDSPGDPDFRGGVLNVAGAGWFDILENTQNLTIRCGLVNALIDAGIVMGSKYPATDALCLTDAWKMQPGYIQFSSIGRWVLDPSDDANFISPHPNFAGLDSKRFMLQEVINDQVVPNVASMAEGALAGLTPQMASVNTGASNPPPPSTAISGSPMTTLWVQYQDVPANGPFPGNAYQHASLLLPAAGTAGLLGTAQMQTDAIFYLLNNNR